MIRTSTFVAVTALAAGAVGAPALHAQSLGWSARSNIVVAGSNPNDPMYATPRGGAYDGVAALFLQRSDGNYLCTGALMAQGGGFNILTAAHCLANSQGQVVTNAVTAVFFPQNVPPGNPGAPSGREFAFATGANAFKINPLYTGEVIDAHDIGVIRLDNAPSAGVTRYGLYSGPTIGQTFQVVGSGASGTGATGATAGGGFTQAQRRTGQNRFDFSFSDAAFGGFWNGFFGSADPHVLLADFDNGRAANDASCRLAGAFGLGGAQFCNLGLGTSEVAVGPGDSGGPEFINGQIAGVTSFGLTFGSNFGDIDNSLNSTYGEFSGYTDVQYNRAFVNSVTPEPGSIVLLGTGLVGLGAFARRRRKA